MDWGESLAPLRSPQFRYFFTGRCVSTVGSSMASVALAFAVLDISDRPADLGYVLAARSIPLAVLMLFGGVVADRFRRDVVLIGSHLASGLTQGVAAALLLTGHATVANLMVIEALNGIAGAMTFPAMQGLMPQVVPAGELQRGNALMGMVRNGALVVGPALGSAVVVAAGSGWAIAADAASFLLAAAAFSRLRLPALLRLSGDSVLRDLRTGWGEFTGRTWLWVIVVCACFQNAIYGGAWVTLGPVVADRTFGRGPWGVILAAQAAGLLIGTITLLRLRFRYPLRAGMLGVAAIAPLLFTLGAAPREWLLVGLAVVAGFGLEVFGIAWETALQQHVPVEVLSRVFAYDALGSLVAIPVGQLTFAPLARAFGVEQVIVAGAIAYLALSVGTLAVPSVWHMRGAQDGRSPG